MKATETDLKRIISHADQQFIVPLFQRTYSWDKKEWQELWNDLLELLELYENNIIKNHFIGSLVTIPIENSISQGVIQYLLVDGQQRLTTILILLVLIRDKTTDQRLAEQIEEQQLINKFAKDKHGRYKLRPTQQDRLVFEKLIDGQDISAELENTQIIQCYRFFEVRLKRHKIELNKLAKIIISQLSVVNIILDPDDNPHLVFESLNARGKPLTQADLIRNFFLMRVDVNKQEEIFKQYWQPMQEALKENLTEYIRHYLMAVKAVDVKKTEVYITLKNYVADTDILERLNELATYANYYQKIIDPINELSLAIRQALKRINRIEVTIAYPFLLKCYHDYKQDSICEMDFKAILHFIENVAIRRSICNVSRGNGLNKTFPLLYREAKLIHPNDFVKGVSTILQKKDYPRDNDFREALITANFYKNAKGREVIKLILESLEMELRRSNNSNNTWIDFDKLHIESIMPQTIKEGDWWQRYLGAEWETDYELYAHTLGNLTFTEFKSEPLNRSFSDKKALLTQSNLELNRGFSALSQWKKEQIERRTKELAELALKVWIYFGDKKTYIAQQYDYDEVTNTSPIYLLIKDQEFNVSTWRDVLINTLNFLAREYSEVFEKLAIDYPKFINNDETALRRAALLINGYYVESNLSAKDIYLFCKQVVELAGFSKDDWQVDYK